MIKDIKELNFPDYATLSQATASIQDMAEKTITSQVKIDGQITPDFSYDWAVEFKGEKYIMPLRQPQGAKENTSLNSTIDLTFQHWAVYWLKQKYFFQYTATEAGTAIPDKWVVPLRLNLKDFCTYLSKVCEYWYGDKITVDLNPDWVYDEEPTGIDISYSYIWDVLIKLYENYAVRWLIAPIGDIDHYVIKIGYPTTEISHIFEYGFEGGLLKVERQVQDENIRNMIMGRGGEKNLPYRYFKKHDKDNDSFSPDPDWIPELADMYFSELHGATFRSYIQGWKAAHIKQYREEYPDEEWSVTTPSADLAYAPWAWMRGYTDEKFNPIEFVANEYNTEQNGYGVQSGSSIAKYGELMGALDNNDDIYPTIQGVVIDGLGRIDEAVAVERISSDNVEEATENGATLSTIKQCAVSKTDDIPSNGRVVWTMTSADTFTVRQGMTVDLDEGPKTVKLSRSLGILKPLKFDIEIRNEYLEIENIRVSAIDVLTGSELSASGIPEGRYRLKLTMNLHNLRDHTIHATVSCETPKLTYATLGAQWTNTWDIWVKNIWESERKNGESDTEYAERVWRPILGDRVGNEAKVVFSDGWLSTSEDYEFVITRIPVPDTSQTIKSKDGKTYPSHWRITLGKSDADLESTGLYVPSTKRQAEAGDHFFFIGIDMPHMYVVKAEERLDDWKKDELTKVKDIKPTWVVGLDKIRMIRQDIPDPASRAYVALEKLGLLHMEDGGAVVLEDSGMLALIDQLNPGNALRLADSRFILNEDGTPGAYETLYIQSVTYTFNEPTDDNCALIPDVEVVLSDTYEVAANPVATLQGEVSALSKQVGAISNIEQIVRAVGDKLYLRKDGIPDRSMSPTEFASLLTSIGFRSGIVGGQGWGFFKDENGNWVLETDRINVRQDMQVNNLVINQITARGGMIIESAARMEITGVAKTDDGYVCYFDQKDGSVANLFHKDDVAYCSRFTPENAELKSYKRRVVAVATDSVTLSESETNGKGIPETGDVIVHYGNYIDKERQFVKVRDVIGGGYERYIEGLDSVDATGTEYYFVGRQSGMYNGRPRWFIGDANGYIEWVNGELNIKGRINTQSAIGDKTLGDYINRTDSSILDTDVLFIQWASQTESPNLPLLNSSGNIAESNGWSTDAPPWQRGMYIWQTTYIKKGDGSGSFSEPVCISGRDGEDGASFSNNLITNSNFIKGLSNWAAGLGLMTVEIDAAKGPVMKWIVGAASRVFNGTSNVWKQGKAYTYSFWAKADDAGCKLRPSRSIADFGQTHTLTTEWVKYHGTINCTLTAEGGSLSISSLGAGTFYIVDVKLEYGVNPDPQWSPHPSEMTGHDGVGIDRIEEEYYLSTSRTELKGGAWSTVRQPWVAGCFYWTRSHIYYTDGTDKTVGEICATGEAGADGTPVYQLDLSNEVAGVACDAQGNVTGTLPKSQASVYRGSHKMTAGVVYSIKEQTGATATVDISGLISVKSLTADTASILLEAAVDGLTLQSTMNVYKVKPGAAGGKGDKGDAAVVYSVLPSVDSVTRHADGSLSASMVTCTVYKTTGATTPVVSNEHTLSYQRLPDGAAGTLTRTNGVSAGVAVLANTEAVIFELKNGATVLDRERVPVLSDVEGFGMGGENLVLNAGFMSRQFLNPICRIDASADGRFQGSNVLKIEAEGFDSDLWHGVWQPYPTNPHMLCEPDTYYSYSMWVYSPDITSFDNGAIWELNIRDKNNGILRYNSVDIVPSKSNGWQRISGRFKTPANAHNLTCQWWIKRNGRLWVAKPQLVRGAILPDWAPSPYDFDYLAEALKQGTTIDGGLVLSSLIKVGYDDAQGNRVVTAGMNGITNASDDVAIWAGGDMQDASKVDSGGAATVFRHDGTGYMANNVIRFLLDKMMVGNDVMLDKNGLTLLGDDGVALEIRNDAIATDFDTLVSKPKTFSFMVNEPIVRLFGNHTEIANPGVSYTHQCGFLLANSKGSVKVSLAARQRFTGGHYNDGIYPWRAGAVMWLLRDGEVVDTFWLRPNVVTTYDKQLDHSDGYHQYLIEEAFSLNFAQEGSYAIDIYIPGTIALDAGNTTWPWQSWIFSVTGEIKESLGNQTSIGNNGFSSLWGNTAFAINQDRAVLRASQYGLSIDTKTGIRATVDNGKTWYTLKVSGSQLIFSK